MSQTAISVRRATSSPELGWGGVKRLAFVLCLVATGCGGQAMPSGQPGLPGGTKTQPPDIGSSIEASAAEMERELASLEVAKKPPANGGDADAAGAEQPVEAGEAPAAPPPTDAEPT